MRLRRGPGGHRRRGAQGPLLRHRLAPQRRLLRQEPTARVAETTEAVPGRARGRTSCLSGRSAPEHPLRQYQAGRCPKILGDGRRQRTRAFTELQSHYLFEDRFGRPGKGNDKGKVEGLVGYVRPNFLVPIPSFESFDSAQCLPGAATAWNEWTPSSGVHMETIGQRWMERDLDALLPLPPVAYDACEKQAGRVSSLSLVRYSDQRLLGAGGLRIPGRPGFGAMWADEVVDRLRVRGIARHTQILRAATTSSTTPSTTCRSWSEAWEPWTRPLRYLQGWALPEEFGTLRRLLELPNGTAGQAGVRAGATGCRRRPSIPAGSARSGKRCRSFLGVRSASTP